MSILDPSYMIDLGGIDVIQSQGVAIPGLYQKLLDNIGPCGNPLIYNWKFNGVFIPPQFVEPILEDDAIYINDIYVSSDDVVHIPSIEIQPTIVQLNVSENGEYEAPEGVDGYNPVTVDVQPNIVQLNVSENGTYETPEGVDGYAPVTVNVSGAVEYLTPGAEVRNTVGVNITKNVPSGNSVLIEGYEFSSGYEGMNVVIRDLTVGQSYIVSFDFQSTDAAFFSGQYTLGYKVSQNAVSSYPTSSTPDASYTAFTRDLAVNSCETQFTATANQMYLIFALVGYSDSRTNYFSISNLRVIEVNE